MSFLNFENKLFLITGVANKKSVAYFSAKTIIENGGNCVFAVQSEEHQGKLKKLFPESKSYIVDVTNEVQVKELAVNLKNDEVKLDGMLHSIAFANLANPKPFHETSWEDFAQATQISSFSLVQLSNELAALFETDASVVTISISDTKATSYGYMGPIKSMLETTCSYLAKSFSDFSQVRFNSVCSGPLKTSASAGIPGYIDNYIFAEKLTMRKQALKTQEVANTVAFLLSNASSGINATGVLVDCGMKSNHFDQEVVSGK